MRIRAAISPCPNDIFIFAGLIEGQVSAPGLEFEFAYHDLETLNRAAQAGEFDLAKISYANHAFCAAEYRLLECGGALGRGCGPLLLRNRAAAVDAAHGPQDGSWDPGAPVLVPGEHTTANFLLDFFARNEGANAVPASPRKVFLPFDELYRRLQASEPCQGVVIHEMRFTYAADGLLLVRDLGEFWEHATGFPIPLGAVALRKRLESQRPDAAAAVEQAIRASLDWAYAHPEAALRLCKSHSQSMAEPVLKAHIDLYVNSFTRAIGPAGREAVAYFLAQQRRFSRRD